MRLVWNPVHLGVPSPLHNRCGSPWVPLARVFTWVNIWRAKISGASLSPLARSPYLPARPHTACSSWQGKASGPTHTGWTKPLLHSPGLSCCRNKIRALTGHQTHCSETKINPNVPQLTSSLQIIISYIYTCHFKNKSKYFTESFTRYCPCTLGACVHAHLEKFLDFSFQLA